MQEHWNEEEFSQALGELSTHAAAAAERPADFWRAQRLAISARIERAPGPHARTAWTLAFAAMVLFAVLLAQPAAVPQPTVAQVDPDHELLLEVQQAVRRPLPEALAPAELLVAELNSALKAQSNP